MTEQSNQAMSGGANPQPDHVESTNKQGDQENQAKGNDRSRFDNSSKRFGINNLQNKAFEGMTPKIGGILCLPGEGYLQKRVAFENFQELLQTYILKTFGEGASPVMLSAIQALNDPLAAFIAEESPDTSEMPTAGSVEEMILKEEIREFVR